MYEFFRVLNVCQMHYGALFTVKRGFQTNEKLSLVILMYDPIAIFCETWVERKDKLISLVKYNVSFNILDYEEVNDENIMNSWCGA